MDCYRLYSPDSQGIVNLTNLTQETKNSQSQLPEHGKTLFPRFIKQPTSVLNWDEHLLCSGNSQHQ